MSTFSLSSLIAPLLVSCSVYHWREPTTFPPGTRADSVAWRSLLLTFCSGISNPQAVRAGPLCPYNDQEQSEPQNENTNNVVSKQVQHKLSCTSTEDGI